MLLQYQQQTQLLLNDPNANLYNLSDLTTWINTARGQIAAAQQCIRYQADITTAAGTSSYPIASLTVPNGVAGALTLRMGAVHVGDGAVLMQTRSWEWFFQYYVATRSPQSGQPNIWSVLEPGPLGTIHLYPIPDGAYTVQFDVSGYPIPLVDDSTVEVLPYTWTDAVPYYAAFLAYLSAQRDADAQRMQMLWQQYATWGTRHTTPTVLPEYSPGGMGAQLAAQKNGVGGFFTGAAPTQGPGR